MKAKVIKSERVQKNAIKKIVESMKNVSEIFGGYDVKVEDENESYRCVVFECNDNRTYRSFLSRAVILHINEAVKEIEKKYEGVYWCVDTRERYTAEGLKYSKCVVEVHAPVMPK